ncbi:MAG: hypothetical protein COV74_00480 [Candidatus Omnitrophica bacterium CG11_big_fil_rev_8_21_14_0_20_45_26]|uniref:Stage V sporulation protein G n=1 Tax=Candidatus Abzuiibacterium crystallinum TaxID=1974748 RepID=A0A2H0LST1_9BACT|nr:MAG: hypothetical protein COV74_00480 [Candidatus Omnitrophica bacterium CG11_big_fil_rev_8_21_14_0_20_45_26]PIW63364.1 MAG: hypothetical protein COW12_10560 [Candidatus Omnitrophica bacterium CG12_big_fil_rev_8_21_14_0_65_45_16]
MKITEVRIFKREDQDKKLRAFATVTFDDCFVIRDIKIIEGSRGLFVAMPSRKVKVKCQKCQHANPIRSAYCNHCGAHMPMDKKARDEACDETLERQSEHKDIAHPITGECREYVQKKILEAYNMQGANKVS